MDSKHSQPQGFNVSGVIQQDVKNKPADVDWSLPEVWDSYVCRNQPEWADIADHVLKVDTNPSSRILITGCGNSKLPMDMFLDGYSDVVAVDFNSKVIAHAKETAERLEVSGVSFKCVDVRDMSSFEANSFDVVLDVSMLDTLSTYRNPIDNMVQYISEVNRVLDYDGAFLVISNSPHEKVWEVVNFAGEGKGSEDDEELLLDTSEDSILLISDDSDSVSSGDELCFSVSVAYHPSHPVKRMLRTFFYSTDENLLNSHYGQLLDPNFWLDLSSDLNLDLNCTDSNEDHTIAPLSYSNKSAVSPEEIKQTRDQLAYQGFSVLPASQHWPDTDLLPRLVRAIEALKERGWPPIFLFMFDEAWQWVHALFGLVEPAYVEDMALEASVYVWALDRKPEVTGLESPTKSVSGNFGLPHRDLSYEDCHFSDGTPSLLTVWVPIVETTLDNGCIYVLPRQHDQNFNNSDDFYHMRAATNLSNGKKNVPSTSQTSSTNTFKLNFPFDLSRPVPTQAGNPILWHANLIHWGSSCHSTATKPRISIALAFHHPDSLPTEEDKESHVAVCGRLPIKRHEVLNLNLRNRLKIVSKSIIMYAHWFPDFGSMTKEFFRKKD